MAEVDVAELGEGTQAVLYPPPAPASGNIVDSTAFLGPVSVGGAVLPGELGNGVEVPQVAHDSPTRREVHGALRASLRQRPSALELGHA